MKFSENEVGSAHCQASQAGFTQFCNKTCGCKRECVVRVGCAGRFQPFRASHALVASFDASLLAFVGVPGASQPNLGARLGTRKAMPDICRSHWTSSARKAKLEAE